MAVPPERVLKHSQESFPFFKLPRELRDRIYAFALVYDEEIQIHTCSCRMQSLGSSTNICESPRPIFNSPLVRFRSTFVIPSVQLKGQAGHGPLAAHTTYSAFAPVEKSTCEMEIDLKIFHVGRQIYEEASRVFYMGNAFEFYDGYNGWPSLVCLAFLNDRPASGLKAIRHIILNIDENARHSCPADSSAWTSLCSTLKAKLTLCKFTLNFSYKKVFSFQSQNSWVWRGADESTAWPIGTGWVNDLTAAVKDLSSLHLRISGKSAAMESSDAQERDRLVAFAVFLRGKMLKNAADLGAEGVRVGVRPFASIYAGYPYRVVQVCSHDDNGGRSLLEPLNDGYQDDEVWFDDTTGHVHGGVAGRGDGCVREQA